MYIFLLFAYLLTKQLATNSEEVLAGHYEEDFPPPPHDDSIEFMSTPFKQYDEPAPPVIRMNEEVIKIDIAADDVDSLHAGVESARIKGDWLSLIILLFKLECL